MKSLYEELGVERTAKAEEIKAAYRRRVRETHPDAGGDAAEFRRVQQAYDVLSNVDSRRRYDEHGLDSENVSGVPSAVNILADALGDLLKDGHALMPAMDIVNVLRGMLTNTSKRMARDAEKMRRRLTEMEGLASRLERIGGEAILEGVMDSWMKPVRAGIATCEAWVANLAQAQGMLKHYRDRGQQAGPSLMDMFVHTQTTEEPRRRRRSL